MSDPFRSELEAARARIEKLESEQAAKLDELRAENDRLRKRLIDIAPSRTKTGRTFFAFAMLALALSLAFGMFFARVVLTPPAREPPMPTASIIELPADAIPTRADVGLDRHVAADALSAVRIDDCGSDVRGHVRVTFAPSGLATLARVDPPLAGTSTGACVEARYKAARVPAFGGPPLTFGKWFVIPKDSPTPP